MAMDKFIDVGGGELKTQDRIEEDKRRNNARQEMEKLEDRRRLLFGRRGATPFVLNNLFGSTK